jgi:hypothetical protein
VCGIVGISLNGVWCVSRSVLIAVVVVVGQGGCWWQTCRGLREHGRPWWMLAVGGHSSWSWFGGRGLSTSGGMVVVFG